MKYQIIFVLMMFTLASSLVLSLEPLSIICGGSGGCEAVQNSIYSVFFGVKVSYLGILFSVFLSFLIFWQMIKPTRQKDKMIIYFLLVGSIIAFFLLYLQHSIIEEYCRYCIIADTSIIVAFLIAVLLRKI